MTIILSNAALLALTLLSGCLIPGGTVSSNDLEGTWCNQQANQTCLTIDQTATQARYTLTVGLCTERGSLSGSLEFSPDTTSRTCLPGFTYGLWSASASFTSTGLLLESISQCQPAPGSNVCDESAFVYADDLDLSHVR